MENLKQQVNKKNGDNMEILVTTFRNGIDDLVTTGTVAVVDYKGNLLYSIGDVNKMAYARSSAKLMQTMVPVMLGVDKEYGFTMEEISQISASHSGEKIHVDTVKSILKKADLNESYLQCGEHYPFKVDVTKAMKERGEMALPIHNNCSGKHAGMIATAKFMNENVSTYYQMDHPVQERITKAIAKICGIEEEKLVLGLDGCGVPVHALPVERFAYGFARMCKSSSLPEGYNEAAKLVVNSVMKHPVNASGSDRIDNKLMIKYPGKLVVKSGANGYFGGGIPEKGIGFAIKTNDSVSVNRNIVLIEVLHQIGFISNEDLEYFKDEHEVISYNHKKEFAAISKATFKLKKHF